MSAVELRLVSQQNLRAVLALSVSDAQRRFVAPNAVSIAEAHFHPEAWFRAIYADGAPAGFLMLHDEHLLPEPRERGFYYLWRFMIDQQHQGRGVGRRAIEQLVEHVRARPHAKQLLLSHERGCGGPGGFYEKVGFCYTGRTVDGELEMSRELSAP